jgi:hypothetical protein
MFDVAKIQKKERMNALFYRKTFLIVFNASVYVHSHELSYC